MSQNATCLHVTVADKINTNYPESSINLKKETNENPEFRFSKRHF